MNQNTRRSRPRRRSGNKNVVSLLEKTNTLLLASNDKEITQVRGILPLVHDVPRMNFYRDKVYTLERNRSLLQSQTSTTVDFTAAFEFKLTDFSGNGDITSLFDQYRIVQAVVTFLPTQQTNASVLMSVIDYDDNSASPITDLVQFSTLMVTQPGTTHERVVAPKAALAAYSGSAFTAYAQAVPGQWFDTDSSGIPHYGLKYAMPALSATGVSTYQVIVKLIIQVKGPR